MEILAIIPARGGSKRTPGKNIKLLAGKPLIAYSIEAAKKSKYITRVIVSTEDSNIERVAKEYGAEVLQRPVELAQDETKTAPVMLHVVEELEKNGYNPDIIVLLQPTTPTRTNELIDNAIEKLLETQKDSILSATCVGYTMPLWKRNYQGKIEALYDYHYRPRHQDTHLKEPMYAENGAFYAITIEAFKKHGDFLGENIEIYETERIIDIDTPEDFENAEKNIHEAEK